MENHQIHSASLDHKPHLPPPSPTKSENAKGGWRAVKYILGNETFEKLASLSLVANIAVYLRTKYNMNGVLLINVVSIWSGTTNFTSIPGALISDTYLGRFRTLLYGSISSFLGMGVMTSTASIPELRPRACKGSDCPQPQGWQLGILFSGLGLLAIGAGGIRPCNIAFGADQFDTTTEKGKQQLESFFNWWYFSFTAALLLALTAVVYIQTNLSWFIGFAIPTGCFFVSIGVFLIGYRTYIIKKPQGSVFVDMAKVIIAACRKRKVILVGPDSPLAFYDPPLPESTDSQIRKLPRTNRCLYLDKAAVITDSNELDDQGKPRNGWRLCSLLQVEQLKMLAGMLPVWLAGVFVFVAMDQQNTIGLLQAIQSDKRIGNFDVPPGWMGLVSNISLSTWILTYERALIPLTRKMTGEKRRLTLRQRISIGIALGCISLLVAGFVEKKRRALALEHKSFESSLSILALIPQFSLSGFTEAFAAVAAMEFLTTQLPESMRTVSGAIFYLSLSIASYINSLLVNVIHGLTTKNGNTPWLGGTDINNDQLENFYFLLAGIEVLNFIYFNLYACRYISIDPFGKDGSENEEKKQDNIDSV